MMMMLMMTMMMNMMKVTMIIFLFFSGFFFFFEGGGGGGSSFAFSVFFSFCSLLISLSRVLQWLPCQTPGVIVSVLGLVGPVSVYCDWVRWRVGSATSIAVWQLVKLSEQIRTRDTLACCWDVKQPTNNNPSPGDDSDHNHVLRQCLASVKRP